MSSTYTERINFIQKTLGKGIISRDGNDLTISCPTCGSAAKKKLAINLETWKYHCWVCSARGNSLVSLLRKYSTRDVVDFYRSHYLNDKILSADIEFQHEEKIQLPDGFCPISTLKSQKSPDVKAVIRYLNQRNITESDFWKYRIGVAQETRYTRRAIFASLDADGEVNYFVTRSADANSRFRYLNATTDKTAIIFNDIDIDWDKPLHLTEGIFDLIALKENGTCLLGSSLSESSLLFKKIVANEADVIICLDNDMTKKIGKISDLLTSYGCNVSIMNTSSAKDIADMTKEQLDYAKSTIEQWNMKSSFHYKIANIKSGSIL